MKFLIKRIEVPIEYIGASTKWGSGETPFVNYSTSMQGRKVGNNIHYKTGLNDIDIKSNKELEPHERNIYCDKLKDFLPRLFEHFPELKETDSNGNVNVNSTDTTFWTEERLNFIATNKTFSDVFDTDENIEDALLYFAIVSGTFCKVSPTYEIAVRNQNDYYLTNESDFAEYTYEEEFGNKRKAFAAVDEIIECKGIDPLLHMTYLTIDSHQGLTKNTSKAVMEKLLVEFIEGKDIKKGASVKESKKNAATKILKNFQLYKTDKETFTGKAILSAAHFYQYIYQKDKKYITSINGTVLGNTLEASYVILMKPENNAEFGEIRDKVTANWNK